MDGAPGEIRTPDRSVRSRVLYPTELQALNLKARFYGLSMVFASLILFFIEIFAPRVGADVAEYFVGDRFRTVGYVIGFRGLAEQDDFVADIDSFHPADIDGNHIHRYAADDIA